MSFSTDCKKEITGDPPKKPCCRRALLCGVLAARGEKDGAARGAVLICNPTGTSLPLELNANGRLTSCSVLTEDGLAEIPLPAELESGAVLLAEYAL